jgi:hypothetical protein
MDPAKSLAPPAWNQAQTTQAPEPQEQHAAPVDYTTHPAATPSTHEGAKNISHLSADCVARIILDANNPVCRQVCKRFRFIEDTIMGRMWTNSANEEAVPEPAKKFQELRIDRARKHAEIENELFIIPADKRKRFNAYALLSNPLQRKELENEAQDTLRESPLMYSLLLKELIPTDQTYEQNLANTQDWVIHKSKSCEELQLPATKSIPNELQGMKSLRNLKFGCASLETIPSWFYKLPLTELSITYSTIPAISADIAQMTSLRKIDFSHNSLVTIPPELALLPNLESADFSGNDIPPESIPEVLKPLIASGKIILSTPPKKFCSVQ